MTTIHLDEDTEAHLPTRASSSIERTTDMDGDAVIRGARRLIGAVDFDVNGINGKGGNGGLISNETIRAADELRLIISRSEGDNTPTPTHHVGSIVPPHCSGSAFVFEPGMLHVNKDGSGYIAVDEDDFILEDDRCEGPDGPEGSVHWIVRLDASEITALRGFLNGAPRAHVEGLQDLVGRIAKQPLWQDTYPDGPDLMDSRYSVTPTDVRICRAAIATATEDTNNG